MNDCDKNASLFAKIGCILAYNGSIYHSTINYSLFSLSLIAAARHPTIPRVRAVIAFTGITAFQIGLCLLVDCSGISIIWCSMAGWLWAGHNCRRPPVPVKIALFADGMGILYYAVAFPMITTVAHVCALGMGFALHLCLATPPSSMNGENQPLNDENQPLNDESEPLDGIQSSDDFTTIP